MNGEPRGDAAARLFFAWVLRYRLAVLFAVTVATVALGLQLRYLHLDPDTEAYVPQSHPARTFWRQTKERFAVGKDIFVGVVAEGEHGIFTPAILAAISRLTNDIKALPTVNADDVRSLSDSEAVIGTAEGLDIVPFFEEAPSTLEEAARVREKVFANEVYLDRLVSRDGSIAAVIVQAHDAYDADSPFPHPVAVFREIDALAARTTIPGARIFIAGSTAVESVFGRQMAADLANLIPLSLVVVVVVLYACFRTVGVARLLVRVVLLAALLVPLAFARSGAAVVPQAGAAAVVLALLVSRGVLLPSLVVAVSLVWMWGLQALLGWPIYIAGTLTPPILLACGCADGIHVVGRYLEELREDRTPANSVLITMVALWRPIVMTSVTTAAGFASLAFGNMVVHRVFGVTTAIGILVALLMSTTLLPAALSLLPPPRVLRVQQGGQRIARALQALGSAVVRRHGAVLAWAAACVLLLLGAATQLRIDYSWVESLEEGTPVLDADRLLRKRHGGTLPLDIVVDTGVTDGVKNPEMLRAIKNVLTDLSAHPAVGDTRSIAEYIERMNEALHEDRRAERRIPDSAESVAQYLLLYSMSGDPTELDDMVDYDYKGAQLGVLLRSDWLTDLADVVAEAEAALDRHVRPLGASATVTGSAMITKVVFDEIFASQVSSLVSAGLLVLGSLVVLFGSFRDALLCMIPATFTAVANFGGMALAGLPLGPAEAMVTAIALGIGIDYSIHFVARQREAAARGASTQAAVIETMGTAGRSILFNGVVVVAGFAVLAFSKTPSNATFGLQIAANMALCCFAALVLLPAFMARATSPGAVAQARSGP